MNTLELSISSIPANVRKVEHFIEKITVTFNVSEKLQTDILLAIIEVTNNALYFANRTDPQKLIRYTARKNKQKITITVEDEGGEYDIRHLPVPGLSVGRQGLTGRGIYIMSKLSDELLFTNNGTKATMSFFLNK